MGQSTNAIVFYGYCWDEEDALDEILRARAGCTDDDDVPDWIEILAREARAVNPWDSYEEQPGLDYAAQRKYVDDWVDSRAEDFAAWKQAFRDVRARYAAATLGTHCSGDYGMPYLATWQALARRGHPTELILPDVDPAWREALDRWLHDMKIEPPQDAPRFWLVSMRS